MFQDQNNELEGDVQKSAVPTATRALLILAIAAVAAGALYAYVVRDFPSDSAKRPFQESFGSSNFIDFMDKGEFDRANASLEELARTTKSPQTKAWAETIIASNNFRQSDLLGGKKLEAIRKLKEIADDANLAPGQRASALNRILNAYYYDRDHSVVQEIFNSEPYSSFLADGDVKLAIRKLAEYSDSISPTAFVKSRIAFWYADELIDNKNLSQQMKNEYGARIIALLKEGDVLFSDELKRGAYISNVGRALFWHFRALALAALKVANLSSADLGDFEGSFNEALKFDEPERGEYNNYMSEFSAYVHFYYAAFLYEIFGDARLADIRMHAKKVTQVVSSAKDPQAVPFYKFFTQIEKNKPAAERDHNYRFFINLAAVSPEFSEFLLNDGWQL